MTQMIPRLLFGPIWVFLCLLIFSSCQQTVPSTDPDVPMFGRPKASTTFLVSADETVRMGDLVKVARIIGPYRELQPQELTTLKARLETELNRLVEIEYAQMLKEQQNSPRNHPLRRRTITRESAREKLLARLGKDLALPLLTSDNRSAVAFGRVSKSDIRITPTAYEISRTTAQEPPRQVIFPSGRKATLINSLP